MGYAPPEALEHEPEGLKKMREKLKDPDFQKLRSTIIQMEPRAHFLLKECGIERKKIFRLVTENYGSTNIDRFRFFDYIDKTIGVLRTGLQQREKEKEKKDTENATDQLLMVERICSRRVYAQLCRWFFSHGFSLKKGKSRHRS